MTDLEYITWLSQRGQAGIDWECRMACQEICAFISHRTMNSRLDMEYFLNKMKRSGRL